MDGRYVNTVGFRYNVHFSQLGRWVGGRLEQGVIQGGRRHVQRKVHCRLRPHLEWCLGWNALRTYEFLCSQMVGRAYESTVDACSAI